MPHSKTSNRTSCHQQCTHTIPPLGLQHCSDAGLQSPSYLKSWERRSISILCPPSNISSCAMKLIISAAEISADVQERHKAPAPVEQVEPVLLGKSRTNGRACHPPPPERILGQQLCPQPQLSPLTFLSPRQCWWGSGSSASPDSGTPCRHPARGWQCWRWGEGLQAEGMRSAGKASPGDAEEVAPEETRLQAEQGQPLCTGS